MNMREELRQSDIQWGINYQRALMRASMKTAAEKMVQKGEMTEAQMKELLTRLEEEIKKL